MGYFDYPTGLTMTSKKFHKLFGGPPRRPETQLTQREMDLAASVQKVTQDIVLKIAKDAARETGEKNLCLAGGVALNCVANGILSQEKIFDNIWIQPAAGDAGGALGAALCVWHSFNNGVRKISLAGDKMKGAFLGPEFSDKEIADDLDACGAIYEKLSETKLISKVVNALVNKKAIGWMQGRMEFGPRALGGRSIIADPRSPHMQKQLNLKVKYRESFRPFAPSVLREDVGQWFEHASESPYMLIVNDVKKDKRRSMTSFEKRLFGIDKLNVPRSSVPAVTHVDYSARIQTVDSNTNPRFHALISKFKEKTGCPLIVNTSFNVRGEPIVCSPKDAFKCFMGTELDILVVGDYLLIKDKQDMNLKENYEDFYELD
jgi:carbamoyltransferase